MPSSLQVPDEFIDQISAVIMRDPVTLPSHVDIDRTTMQTLLLQSGIDPFNRQPFTVRTRVCLYVHVCGCLRVCESILRAIERDLQALD